MEEEPFTFQGKPSGIRRRNIVGGKNLQEQARQALKNLQIEVEAAGVKLNDVVSLRIYVVGDQSSQIGSVREVLREFFSGEKPPTSTWLGVASLAVKDFLIEIEAIAVMEEDV